MPALGMAQETGMLVSWLKHEGEVVTQGEPLMEVETDKATVEIEAAASGTLAGVSAQPGDNIPVGQS
jgi:pyruvate/2-oxoglutarate dehydrogenase complex dihydrolipoamide acyltransferase (E2) component